MLDYDRNYRKNVGQGSWEFQGQGGVDGGGGAAFSINGVVRVGFIEKVFGFGGQQALIIS